jgi:hypothetical protein
MGIASSFDDRGEDTRKLGFLFFTSQHMVAVTLCGAFETVGIWKHKNWRTFRDRYGDDSGYIWRRCHGVSI